MYLAKCIDDDKTYPIDPESIREEKVVKTRDNYHCVLIAKIMLVLEKSID